MISYNFRVSKVDIPLNLNTRCVHVYRSIHFRVRQIKEMKPFEFIIL